MRAFLITIISLSSLKALSQRETFLLYATHTDWLIRYPNDTTFRLDGFVVLDTKNLTIRSLQSPHLGYTTTKRIAKCTRVGDQITFFDEGKSKVAKIIGEPIFKGGNNTGYFLVPIKNNGLRIAPFEGQLIDYYPSVGKIKFIVDTIRSKQTQMTYLINFASGAEERHPMIYLDEKYFHLTSLPGLGWFQLNKITSDSIWHVSIYPAIANKGESTAWERAFTKRGLLTKSALKGITEKLQGKWSQTSGLKGGLAPDSVNASFKTEPLTDCKYTFTFEKDKMLLERSSLNPEIKTIDTLGYSINSSGDWIRTVGTNEVDIILNKLDSKYAQFSVRSLYGNESCNGYLVLHLRKE